MRRFKDRVAIVTGAADGIGKAIAYRIADEYGKVVLVDINDNLLKQTLKEFSSLGLEVDAYTTDISKEDQVAQLFKDVQEKYGQLDILVNSAGIVGPTSVPIAEYPTEAFDTIYNINLRGSFLMVKYAVAIMEKKQYGRILLLASIAGKEGNPNMVGYSTMKAGVIGLVKGVGKEYAEKNITVNGLAPAVIKTPMNADTSAEQLEYMTSKIPMKRLGTVDEVAALASWIVSSEASFTTGFVFDISGGRATY